MKEPRKKQIVISGVNLFSGGTLTILRQCLSFLENSKEIATSYSVLALVHKKELFPAFKNIEVIAYPKPRGNWLWKLYYEYIFFKKISTKRDVYLWFSLYDMSPSVKAERRAVYCHNPAPFYRMNKRERRLDKIYVITTSLYKHLYAVNIQKNNYIVVQQEWIRQKFIAMFSLPAGRIIVAHPEAAIKQEHHILSSSGNKICFLFPALPRIFKNFEVIINAVLLIKKQMQTCYEVVFTISGNENKYATHVSSLSASLPEIKLIGLQSKEDMNHLYARSSCLLFPSKLETWGLPITEAKEFHLPILVADLPYAKETVGDYAAVSFFKPDDAETLAGLMIKFINKEIRFDGNKLKNPAEPFSESWRETFGLLLSHNTVNKHET